MYEGIKIQNGGKSVDLSTLSKNENGELVLSGVNNLMIFLESGASYSENIQLLDNGSDVKVIFLDAQGNEIFLILKSLNDILLANNTEVPVFGVFEGGEELLSMTTIDDLLASAAGAESISSEQTKEQDESETLEGTNSRDNNGDSGSKNSEFAIDALGASSTNGVEFNAQPVVLDVNDKAIEEVSGKNLFEGQLTVTDADPEDTGLHVFSYVEGSIDIKDTGIITEVEDDVKIVIKADGSFSITGDFNNLAQDEIATVSFDYISTDVEGFASEPATITLTVTGTNDAPVITNGADTAALTETDTTLTATGTMLVTDVDTTDVVTSTVESVVVSGTNGSDTTLPNNDALKAMMSLSSNIVADGATSQELTWDFDSAGTSFDYLATGETLILTYTIQATDDDGTPLNDTDTVTVTITGTNDAPKIVSGSISVETTTEDTLTGNLEALGAGNFTDVDTNDTGYSYNVLDKVSTTITKMDGTSINVGSLTVSMTEEGEYTLHSDSPNSLNLADGQQVKVSFDVTITDGTANSAVETVFLVLTGTNSGPTITVGNADNELTEAGVSGADTDVLGTSVSAIKMTKADADGTASYDKVVMENNGWTTTDSGATYTKTGVYGDATFTVLTEEVSYKLDDTRDATQELNKDSTNITDSFTIFVKDDSGETASANAVFTIKGTNDAPKVLGSSEAGGSTVSETTSITSKTSVVADINAIDIDGNDTKLNYSIVDNGNTDDGQLLKIDQSTGVVTFKDTAAYTTWESAGKNPLSFEVKVTDEKGAETTVNVDSGSAIDGYISGMTVFSDLNSNGVLDDGEANAITNNKGDFTLIGDLSGTIVGYGGTDVSTGLDFEGMYKAPSGSSILNSVTTLIVNLIEASKADNSITNLTVETASAKIIDNFFPGSIIDLMIDPIAKAVSGDFKYLELQALNILINNTVGQLAAAMDGSGIIDEVTASDIISQELAKMIIDGLVDLRDLTNIGTLITNVLANDGSDLPLKGDINDIINIIVNTNNAILSPNGQSVEEILESFAKAQIAAEETEKELEEAIEADGSDTSAASANSTGDGFNNKVDNAEAGAITKEQIETTKSNNEDDLDNSAVINQQINLGGGIAVTSFNGETVPFNETITLSYNNEDNEQIDIDVTFVVKGDGTYTMTAVDDINQIPEGKTVRKTIDYKVDGSSTTSKLFVEVVGQNDIAEITVDSLNSTAVETNNGEITGTLATLVKDTHFTDVDNGDTGHAYVEIVSGTTIVADETSGTATIVGAVTVELASDGSYKLSGAGLEKLSAGEKVKVSFDVYITDGTDLSLAEVVDLIITGTNDAPIVIENSLDADINEASNGIITGTLASLEKNITFTDVDENDSGTYSYEAITAGTSTNLIFVDANVTNFIGDITVEMDSAGAYKLSGAGLEKLSDGEQVKVSFDVKITDGTDSSEMETVVLTVTGTNDAPTVVSPTQVEISESALLDAPTPDSTYAGSVTNTGTDVDAGDDLTYSYSNNLFLSVTTMNAQTVAALANPTNPVLFQEMQASYIEFVTQNPLVNVIIGNSSTITQISAGIQSATNATELLGIMNSLPEVSVLANGEVTITRPIPELTVQALEAQGTLVIDMQDDGSYTVTSPLFDAMSSTESVIVAFDYVANDGSVDSNNGTVSLKINGTVDVTLSEDNGEDILSLIDVPGSYSMADLLSGIPANSNVDSVDLSQAGEHILSNINVSDVIALTDADHKLSIVTDGDDEVNLDKTQWQKSGTINEYENINSDALSGLGAGAVTLLINEDDVNLF
jgi:VCBS repeat-containing protein